ncbi:uncharacterized protein METZ01_LOCUS458732, partial [marine metagenome]
MRFFLSEIRLIRQLRVVFLLLSNQVALLETKKLLKLPMSMVCPWSLPPFVILNI